MVETSADEFFKRKRDFSPFLVHLTKDKGQGNRVVKARMILKQILEQCMLKASNYYCLFNADLDEPDNASLRDKFKVVCFTETPIDLLDVLLLEVEGRYIFRPKPYGLIFKKDFIREREGSPAIYASPVLYNIFWEMYRGAKENDFSREENRVLSLVNKCDEEYDFHWEREWRVVGNLHFFLKDIYCGLCPKEEIEQFECSYYPVRFIDPRWGINQILDKLVERATRDSTDFPFE